MFCLHTVKELHVLCHGPNLTSDICFHRWNGDSYDL